MHDAPDPMPPDEAPDDGTDATADAAAASAPVPPVGARRPEDRLLIRVFQALDVCLARIYHQTIVKRPPQLPRYGPAILVCNHTSSLDPALIQSVCPRL